MPFRFAHRLLSLGQFALPAVLAIVALWRLEGGYAADNPFTQTTVTYKQVGDTKIEADVYHFDDDQVRPVVVHIHGGALMMGSRRGLPYNLREACEKAGVAVVSIDYRLAPEV